MAKDEPRKGTVPRGPASDHVAANVREVRGKRSLADVANAASDEGRPTLPTAVHKIERGTRQITVDDLVTLAVVLDVSPLRLLLPVDEHDAEVALTPETRVLARQAWAWALGRRPLPDSSTDAGAFRRDSVPTWERAYEMHTAVQVADELVRRLKLVLHARDLAADESWPAGIREVGDHSEQHSAAGLRRALNRLVAEVDDLLADEG